MVLALEVGILEGGGGWKSGDVGRRQARKAREARVWMGWCLMGLLFIRVGLRYIICLMRAKMRKTTYFDMEER